MAQPAMFGWQAPLAALFSGISAAGQPGGWSNFGQGVQQGQQNFQQGQQNQQMMQLRQQQIQMQQDEARRAEKAAADAEARKAMIAQMLSGGGQQQVQPVGNSGAATGGAAGQTPAMFGGMSPQQSALFGQYAQVDPEGAFQMMVERGFAEPKEFKPNVEEFYDNGQRVKGYLDQNGNLVKVGDSAPLFAPQQGPGPSDRAKRAKEAGLLEGTPEFNAFVLSSDQAAANPKQENILRDEFNALTKDFRTVQDAFSKIESTSPTGAGDMSMLYSYVKLLDPGSVVRESEFATAAASGSFGEQVQGAVARLATGERLPDSLRAAFKNEAKSIFKAQQAGYNRLKTSYGNLATRTGVPSENVIVDYAAPEVTVGAGLPKSGGPSPFDSGAGADLPTVSTPEEAAQLPKGTRFRDPDGNVRVVP